jgi:hypothetical protein
MDCAQFGKRPIELADRAGGDCNGRSVVRQRKCNRAPDAAGAAGDEGDGSQIAVIRI